MSASQHYLHRYKLSMAEMSRNWISNTRICRRRSLPADVSFEGKTVIVTGGNRGIGRKICDILVERKVGRLILACRDVSLAEMAAKEIRNKFKGSSSDIAVYQLDLSSQDSIRQFAQQITTREATIDVLINNAAILCKERKETIDRLERMIGVNYFGTVMLSFLLFDHMKSAPDPRIIFTSSLAHTEVQKVKIDDLNWENDKSFPFFAVYGHSKLALLLFVKNFAAKALAKGVLVHSVDPGISKTDLGRDVNQSCGLSIPEFFLRGGIARPSMRSVSESAHSVLQPLVMPRDGYDVLKYNTTDGVYQKVSPAARDQESANKLWSVTADLLDLDVMRFF